MRDIVFTLTSYQCEHSCWGIRTQRLLWYQFATSVLNQTPFYQLLRDIYIIEFAGEVHAKILSPLEPFMSYHKKVTNW